MSSELEVKGIQLHIPGNFAEFAAHFQCELIALHPFYELNGRITRLFFDLIALNLGYFPINYETSIVSATGSQNE